MRYLWRSRPKYWGSLIAVGVALAAAGCGTASNSGSQQEDKFPEQTIRVIVPASPGGSADIVARQLEGAFSKALGGATLRIDNLPGGGMNVGAVAAAHAKPDCYTMLVHIYPNLLLGNLTTKDVDYKPEDFYPLGTATYEATVLRVRNDSPWQTINDLVNAIRTSPGKYKVAISPQSSFHLSALYFREALNLDFALIPYGGAESRLALEKGEVDFLISGVFNTQSIASTTRVLAVLDEANKWPELTNNAPAASQALGTQIPGISSRMMGLVPVGCKTQYPNRFAILEQAFQQAVNSDEYLEELKKTKTEASRFPLSAAETDNFLKEQVPVMKDLVAKYEDLQPK